MGQNVKKETVQHVKNSKYYSVILDCTRDLNHIEQMSLVLRFVNASGHVEEHFTGFLTVQAWTKQILFYKNWNTLTWICLIAVVKDMAMVLICMEKKVELKQESFKKIQELFFTPCGCHNWNLLLCDAASSCTQAELMFGIIQIFYTLFAASSNRWSILIKHIQITLQPLSETHWECRVESVKAVKYQMEEICDALLEVSGASTGDAKIRSESLATEILSYRSDRLQLNKKQEISSHPWLAKIAHLLGMVNGASEVITTLFTLQLTIEWN